MSQEKTVFERIAAGEIPARIVYQDDVAIAFLDRSPNHPGHTLVVPRAPHANIFELPDDVAAHIFVVAKKVAAAVKTAVGAEGINIVMNNGEAAGQDVFHSHIHVIPRHPNDGGYRGLHNAYANDAEADAVAEKIRVALA